MIPMVDPKAWHGSIQSELERVAADVLRSGRYLMGPNVDAFENEMADYLGSEYALSCASGTDALYLALRAAGIGEGDEVITTAFTFFATAEAIVQAGARPVFVDIEPDSFNMNPEPLKQALTNNTKAILLVHLFGLPARVRAITTFCEEHDLLLIEDCAQSFGASIEGQMTGTFGQLGCYSFFPSKNLGGFGDGGLVVTSNDEYADRIRQLRNHGSSRLYQHELIGCNSRLDEFQAALLRVKLRHIDEYNRQRQWVATLYSQQLAGLDLQFPSGEGHVYHQYTVLLNNRHAVKQHLEDNGIASAVYYPTPLHQQTALKGRCHALPLPVTEYTSKHCLSLPVYPGITDEAVHQIITQIHRSDGLSRI